MVKRKVKFLCMFMCSVFLISSFTLAFEESAQAAEGAKQITDQSSSEEQLLSEQGDFVKFLKGVEQLPPGIEKQSPEKIAKWISKKTGVEVEVDGENLIIPSLAEELIIEEATVGQITTFSTWDCITAVGLLIATVGFPASKILQLNKAIKMLGGVTKTVKRIKKRYNELRNATPPWKKSAAWKKAVSDTSKDLPGQVGNALLDFFNITNVINQCT